MGLTFFKFTKMSLHYKITFTMKDGSVEEYLGIGHPTTDGTYTIVRTVDNQTLKILKSDVSYFNVSPL